MPNMTQMIQLLQEIPPEKLGQLVARVNQPERFLGRGLFQNADPGMIGKSLVIRNYGGVPEVRQ